MINIGIFGATGYTGVETIRLLQRHGHARLAFAHSDSNAGMRLSDVIACPYDVLLIKADDAPLDKVDVVFSCLPHGPSAELCARVPGRAVATVITPDPAAVRARAAVQGWPVRQRPGALACLLPEAPHAGMLRDVVQAFDGVAVESVSVQPVGLAQAYLEVMQAAGEQGKPGT